MMFKVALYGQEVLISGVPGCIPGFSSTQVCAFYIQTNIVKMLRKAQENPILQFDKCTHVVLGMIPWTRIVNISN